jgi:hypothetical protein
MVFNSLMISPISARWKQIHGSLAAGDLGSAPLGAVTPLAIKKRESLA